MYPLLRFMFHGLHILLQVDESDMPYRRLVVERS